MTTTPGRRERKKARTRAEIADSALRLFAVRGFDAVTLADVADAADVSVTTVFKHFPQGKESLVFDEDETREAELLAALHNRAAGQSVLVALREHWLTSRQRRIDTRDTFGDFVALVGRTPALREYGRRLWLELEPLLATELAAERGVSPQHPSVRALAHLAVEALLWATRQPEAGVLAEVFEGLERGWPPEHAEGPR